MDEKTITALAREYAEWVTESEGGSNAYIPAETAIASALLRWLSRRYCLVEKEAVRKWTGVKLRLPELRERVLICERVGNQYKIFIGKRVPSPCPDGWEWNQSTKESVVAWMPLPQYQSEIAKEVEG